MDGLELLLTRRSIPLLQEPGPAEDQLHDLLRAASAAPDHKRLRPWRFVVMRGDARKRFGEALAAATAEDNPRLTPDNLERVANKAFLAPVLIAIVASPKADPAKTPRWEQVASAAAAAQNLSLAAHALGLGAAWRSTALRDHPAIRAVLQLTDDEELLVWIMIGQRPADLNLPSRPEIDLSQIVSELSDDGLQPYVPPA